MLVTTKVLFKFLLSGLYHPFPTYFKTFFQRQYEEHVERMYPDWKQRIFHFQRIKEVVTLYVILFSALFYFMSKCNELGKYSFA